MKQAVLLLAALLVGAACSERKPAEPASAAVDKDGWPASLHYFRLELPEATLRRQALDGTAAGYNLLAPNVIKRHYDEIGPTAHGAAKGTDVFWIPDKGVFFLRSDCDGHHVDGYLGPFAGDPRQVLKPN